MVHALAVINLVQATFRTVRTEHCITNYRQSLRTWFILYVQTPAYMVGIKEEQIHMKDYQTNIIARYY